MAFTLGAAPVRKVARPSARENPQIVYNASKELYNKQTTEYNRRKSLGLVPDQKMTLGIWKSAETMYNAGAQLAYWSTGWASYMISQTKLLYPYLG